MVWQTSSLLTFATYNLSMYPRILQRLRAEILEKVGTANRPTYDHIREMKYLRAVLNGEQGRRQSSPDYLLS